jgi:hypothetical protein
VSHAKDSAPSNPQEPAGKPAGKPTDSGSRQQTHEDQALQSGSPELDKEATRRSGGTPPVPLKPPGPK